MKGSNNGKKRASSRSNSPSTHPKKSKHQKKLQKSLSNQPKRTVTTTSTTTNVNDTLTNSSSQFTISKRGVSTSNVEKQQIAFAKALLPKVSSQNIASTIAITTPIITNITTSLFQQQQRGFSNQNNNNNNIHFLNQQLKKQSLSSSTLPFATHLPIVTLQNQLNKITKRKLSTKNEAEVLQKQLYPKKESDVTAVNAFLFAGEDTIETYDNYSIEEQRESRQVIDKLSDLYAASDAMLQFMYGEDPVEELIDKFAAELDLSLNFKPEEGSCFPEMFQRLSLYKAVPKSIRLKTVYKTLPDDFNREEFVTSNIELFHSSSFPSDDDILTVINFEAVKEDFYTWLSGDVDLELQAQVLGFEYIGSEPSIQNAIKRRVQRDTHHANQLLRDPQQELQLLSTQMDGLDGLLSFALPKVTPQQHDAMVIAHLKKKALLLSNEYASDPLYSIPLQRKQHLHKATLQLQQEQEELNVEMDQLIAEQNSKNKDFEGENKENNDDIDAIRARVAKLDADNEQTLQKRQLLLQQRQNTIDTLTARVKSEQKQLNQNDVTIGTDSLAVLRKIPAEGITTEHKPEDIGKIFKNKPLVHGPGQYEQFMRQETAKKREKASKKPTWLRKLSQYYQLTKPRISQMVAFTSLWGYWSVGNPTSWSDLALLTTGTIALSSSASIINQIRETDVDAKMTRTMSRPLVTKAISIDSAKKQAVGYGLLGAGLLSPLTTMVPLLGLSNVALYGGLYTSLKRTTRFNTEVGALVGAIPPLMGYFAALQPDQAWDSHLTAMCFPAAMMIAWQIQHVMLICVRRGEEYNRSGLVMQCKDDPDMKGTINKGIAWSVISTVISAIPFFTGHADLTQLFTTYMWAVYTVPYAIAMKKRDSARLGQVLLAGYALLGFTILLSLNAQVPADTWAFLFTDGPATPSPLPEQAPSLMDTLFRGAGRVGTGSDIVDAITTDITPDDTTTTTTTNNAAPTNIPLATNQAKLASLTEQMLNSDATPSAQDDV